MKFDYYKITLDNPSFFLGKNILRPIIPVELNNKDKSVNYFALIDSGADYCIIDAEVGEYLGLDVTSGLHDQFGGIQNTKKLSNVYFHDITIAVGGWNFQVSIGFSYDIAPNGYGILGQKGFFDIFTVLFNYNKERIEIKEIQKSTK